jgi:hypothetical protein
MHVIAYTSDCQCINNGVNSALLDITCKSRKNNKRMGITGALYLNKNTFLHIIEGARDTLESLMITLRADTRHKNIVRIIDEEVLDRSTDILSMDSFRVRSLSLSDGEYIDLKDLTKAGVLQLCQKFI